MDTQQIRRRRTRRGIVVATALALVAGGAVAATAAQTQGVQQVAAAECAAPWSSSAVYTAGNVVSYGGHNWRAKWWTQNETPRVTDWGVWEDQGVCGGGPTTPPPTTPPASGGEMAGAPYLYLGWGNPPSATSVMDRTGVKAFTMAFMLSSGGCNPAWDGTRPLTGGVDQQTIDAIHARGGQVQISFGGWSGNKLGPNCSSPEAFAGAVQKVIDAHHPEVVDFDIENSDEFENADVQDRILRGLAIVKQKNPATKIVVTFGTSQTGPNWWGGRLIDRAKEFGTPIDNYTIMPFDFGATDIVASTISASEGLKNKLKAAHGWTDAQAYAHMGISGMNGVSDVGETTTTSQWTQIRDWATSKGLGRFAFWSVNRDRSCASGNGGAARADCSGISQPELEFTRITAGF
ncbi:carbohydrate-binding protein [Myceligenerans crystallogenes]|uniref:Chitin-binding type-3 domain-containing protein n=1 Tax=Myceligenerans crystallogenes TaxID=316335 RepID=A0ABN2NII8_9MICO